MRNKKNQKGAISVFVICAMAFFMLAVLGAYTIASRRGQTQDMSLTELQGVYKEDSRELVKARYASKNEVIPVYNIEHFKLIGSNQYVEVNGKIYKYGANEESSDDNYSYILKGNIIVNIDEYFASDDISKVKFLDAKFYSDDYKIDKAEYDLYYYKSTTDVNYVKQNAYWKTMVYQNTYIAPDEAGNTETGLFTAGNIAEFSTNSIKSLKTYSVLNELNDDYKFSDDGFEFLLIYNTGVNKKYDVNKYNWWIQSENPLNIDELENGGTLKTVANGYKIVDVRGGYSTPNNETTRLKSWGGLVLSNSGKTKLDGSTYSNEFWYSVGVREKIDNGTPANTTDDGIKGFPETISSQYYLFTRVNIGE